MYCHESDNMFELKFQNETIAELDIISTDQPWITCNVTKKTGFSNHQAFFKGYQSEYSSHSVKDFDLFFSRPSKAGYTLVGKDSEVVRFILLWDDSCHSVRLRGQHIKCT